VIPEPARGSTFVPLVIGSGAPLRALTAQLKTSAASAGSSATDGAKLGCDAGFAPVVPGTQGFRGLRPIRCEPKCDGCDAWVRTLQASRVQDFCGFQAVSATGGCELRTRIRALPLAKDRAAPPRTYLSPGRTRHFSWLAEAAARWRTFRSSSRPTKIGYQTHRKPKIKQPVGQNRAGCRDTLF
jgi:hypothetical protein